MAEVIPYIPMTLSTAASLAGSASTVAGTNEAAAAAVTGYNQAGQAALTTGQYNADVQEARAQNALTVAAANAIQIKQQTTRKLGDIGAAYGAAGVEGSTPLQVMQDSAIQGELTRQLTLYQGDVTAQAARQQGALDIFQGQSTAQADAIRASAASSAASTKNTGTLLTAAGSLFGPNGAGSSLLSSLSKSKTPAAGDAGLQAGSPAGGLT